MSDQYCVHNHEAVYFVTSTNINEIDLFGHSAYKDIVTESLQYHYGHKKL